MQEDVEALIRPEAREQLPLGRLLRLYLDPFVLFKNATIGAPPSQAAALEYNRRHRRILLAYAWRWAAIAVACLLGAMPLGALARAEPVLYVPFLGLELGFSLSLCVVLLAAAVYFLLGLDGD